ncbi:hypothetical protein N8564_01065, partial [Verrucomicrobiales bacterium]|nr:hypothetical protein [Verrucomicrobiales bacterium]
FSRKIYQFNVDTLPDVRSNIEVLVHFQRRFGGLWAPDQDGGYTGEGAVSWDVRENHASRSYLGPFADLQIPENLSSRPDQQVPPHFWMTINGILTRAPKSYLVKHGNIILNDGGLSDHDRGGVINENAFPNLSRGVNINAKYFRNTAL